MLKGRFGNLCLPWIFDWPKRRHCFQLRAGICGLRGKQARPRGFGRRPPRPRREYPWISPRGGRSSPPVEERAVSKKHGYTFWNTQGGRNGGVLVKKHRHSGLTEVWGGGTRSGGGTTRPRQSFTGEILLGGGHWGDKKGLGGLWFV